MFVIDTDPAVLRDVDALVDDGAADDGIPSDLHVVEQDAVGDRRVTVDADLRREHRVVDLGTTDDHAGGDHRGQRLTHAVTGAVDELRRRQRGHRGVDGPVVVVEVEDRVDRDEVHVGVVVGVHRPHVAPVATVAFGRAGHVVVLEVVDIGVGLADEARDYVATHVVLAALEVVVLGHRLDELAGCEDVVAHGGEHLVGRIGEANRVGRLLAERPDLAGVGGVDLDDTELVGQVDRLTDRRDGERRARLDVLLDHLREVHAVDVVGTDDDDDLGLLVIDQVEALEDRVCAAEIPVLVHALLGGHRGDVVAEDRRHAPGLGDVLVQAVGLVLRQHDDLEVAGVDDIGQGEVDESIDAAERHCGFGSVSRERHQPLALPTRQDDGQNLGVCASACHGSHPRGRPLRKKRVIHVGLATVWRGPRSLRLTHARRHHQQGISARHLRRRGGACG